MSDKWTPTLEQIDECRWRIPRTGDMRVPGVIYSSSKMLEHIRMDKTPLQVANVAHLPGIVERSMAMPDIHWGYGFAIGGVAATDAQAGGVISPGGVGYDINCGVRLLRTNLKRNDIKDKLRELIGALYHNIPSGVGSTGRIHLSRQDVKKVLEKGARWAVEQGYGAREDLIHTEEEGCLAEADAVCVSQRAVARGFEQLGTLGAGNHFLEIQEVENIYNEDAARELGLEVGQITLMIHTGSRGLGFQVCDDSLRVMQQAIRKYKIDIPDRQLACAPIGSEEGQSYFGAMCAAANYAWANRQCIMHWSRQTFEKILGMGPRDLGMNLVYDVAHNIAKMEEHTVEGRKKKLCVHRKGATRAFAPGHGALPEDYRKLGQPVIIPGTMGTNSYVLLGTKKAMEETWGSTCHGSGRVMSRTEATKRMRGQDLKDELEKKNIIVQAKSFKTLAEEAPGAYKDVNAVVGVCERAGISTKVARMRPLGVIKG
ncbi:MAG: RtcB family protein [bacterium]